VFADPEMLDAVRVYVGHVESLNGERWVEHRFDLSHVHPGLFGTADCVVYNPKTRALFVIDYKHGAGIPVEVVDNEQLMYYAFGALSTLKLDVEKVVCTIVQPRCPHPEGPIRSWMFPLETLLDFGLDLVEFARRTEDPNAPLVPGEHCRFCPAAGANCTALQTQALAVAQQEFSPLLSYDPAALAEALQKLPMLEAFVKQVRAFAYSEAEQGRCPPGWKLVQKRATRRWRSEDEAKSYLLETVKLTPDDILESALKSPAQIEKFLSRDGKKALAELIVAESSGLTLAPEHDKREAARVDVLAHFKPLPLVEAADE
jgi:hypothetical protein